jgi:hypothetical protein
MLYSRRTLLRYAGAAFAGVATGTALSTTIGSRIADAEPVPPSGATSTYLTGSFSSAARRGAQTTWAIARPPGRPARCDRSSRCTQGTAMLPA